MHPDALVASLRQELEQCGDDNARRQEILAEIDATTQLDRPTIVIEGGSLEVADKDQAYLDGLRKELDCAEPERRDQIRTEIGRMEALIQTAPAQGAEEDEQVIDEPSVEEIEQRKQVRGGRRGKVERARNAPVPDEAAPADQTAPAQGAEED